MSDSDSDSGDRVEKKKESFWKRNLLRLSSSRSSSTGQQQLIPQAEVVLPPEALNAQSKIRRPRSAGDLSETIVPPPVSTFPGGSCTPTTENNGIVSSSAFSRPSSPPTLEVLNNNNNEPVLTGGSGGILSFFGVKFKSSPNKHLEKVSCQESLECKSSNNNKQNSDPRYTKFPLTRNPLIIPPVGGSTSPSSSSSKTVKSPFSGRSKPKLSRSLDSSQVDSSEPSSSTSHSSGESRLHPSSSSNSPFEESQIQFTPQTRTYAHPHRSPLPVAKSSSSSSSGNFITNIGRKVVNSVTPSSKHKNKSKLKVKSKSDNNLNRVNSEAFSPAPGPSTSAGGVPRNSSASTFSHLESQLEASSSSQRRLNSVQLGDHATIRLPWTGFQPINNLSSVSSNRTFIPNTHTNNLDTSRLSSERYVECGGGRAPQGPSGVSERCTTRRRSRSLERSTNFRVFPSASVQVPHWGEPQPGPSGLTRSQSRKEAGSEKEKQKVRSSHSLERNSSQRLRTLLSPTEQDILFRNVDLTRVPPEPPRRPDKVSTPRVDGPRKEARRPFEKLHRSAPNSSFSNSSESGDSSYSAPPSPPPRPPSTLKPNSRLIIHHPTRHQSGSLSPGSCSRMMNPIPKRRPVVPRSHGSSSDSGVSQVSTMRGSDFSDESAGSVNISQHTPSTTSSSGVSHQSSSAVSSSAPLQPASGGAAAVVPPPGISLEDVRNSGFINKPSKGWLHSDQMLGKEGVTYTVRYIGCLDVNTSMKSLDFDTRSLIAKECINQVCEAANLRSQDKKRKIDRRVARILGVRPRLEHAGSDVRLTITSTCLKLTSLETGAVIAVHDMPNISFASGGDATMLDFVAYVAKDAIVGRACFVLECGSGLAQDVITTVGQAFELRFKEYLQKRPPPQRIPMDDPEYYNDLPGKVPPDVHNPEGKEKIQNVPAMRGPSSSRAKEPPPLNLQSELTIENLIDFEAPTPPAFGPSVEDKQLDSFLLPGSYQTNGANNLGAAGHSNCVGTGLGLPNSPSQPPTKDPFDMQPFAASLPHSIPAEASVDQRRLLEGETWFHGTVSRNEAEDLLKHDGDFLVRESMACPGQFVLTGLQGGSPKHLLLVDPEGIVRTKDRTFDNVIHLIKYHSDNCLPIISAESMLLLRNPVQRVISSS